MATTKFIGASPYKTKQTPPKEDYLYAKYEKDVNQDMKATSTLPPTGMAIFGLGRAGSIHLSNIVNNTRVKLMYIVDEFTDNWESIRKYWNLKDVKFLTPKNSSTVYMDPMVAAVVVASPTYTHENIITNCIKNKQAVFSEKPIGETIEETARCYELADSMNVPLFCAFNRRFDPSYSALRDRVRNGEVGHVQVIKVTARDSPLPTIDYLKISGGIFHDCMVHDIDMCTWILGELPTSIQVSAVAHIPEIKDIDDFDTVCCMLTFPSGSIAMLDISRMSNYGYDQRLEVFGPKGMIRADNERPFHCNEVQLGQTGSIVAPIWYSFPSRFKLAYYKEMEHFLDILEGKTKSMVTEKEILAVSKIATAAETSARTRQTINMDWN